MSKLQNNFTTPSQSKRLLELGVPKDSADCFICTNPIGQDTGILDFPYSEIEKEGFLPCWSVGRLIEIYTECIDESKGSYIIIHKKFVMDDVLYRITEDFDYLDFSKLEE